MKLTKDTLIEGQIVKKGIGIEILNEATVMSKGEQTHWIRRMDDSRVYIKGNIAKVYIMFSDYSEVTYTVDISKGWKILSTTPLEKSTSAYTFNMQIRPMDFSWIIADAREG